MQKPGKSSHPLPPEKKQQISAAARQPCTNKFEIFMRMKQMVIVVVRHPWPPFETRTKSLRYNAETFIVHSWRTTKVRDIRYHIRTTVLKIASNVFDIFAEDSKHNSALRFEISCPKSHLVLVASFLVLKCRAVVDVSYRACFCFALRPLASSCVCVFFFVVSANLYLPFVRDPVRVLSDAVVHHSSPSSCADPC